MGKSAILFVTSQAKYCISGIGCLCQKNVNCEFDCMSIISGLLRLKTFVPSFLFASLWSTTACLGQWLMRFFCKGFGILCFQIWRNEIMYDNPYLMSDKDMVG